jgi:hypothetical protein
VRCDGPLMARMLQKDRKRLVMAAQHAIFPIVLSSYQVGRGKR